jgi:GntR family transcriptional regulator
MSSKSSKPIQQPRYAWLREQLVNDIRSGKYPVGTLLPAENQLAATYGVSRQTVREDSRKLADVGLISRHPGIGTIVCANKEAPAPYVAALGSLQELFEYTNTTRLELLAQTSITADAKMAEALKCEPGSEWIELRARRHVTGQAAPISFTKVYLRPEFSAIKDRLRGQHMSIYAMLEQDYGEDVYTVRQVARRNVDHEAIAMVELKRA